MERIRRRSISAVLLVFAVLVTVAGCTEHRLSAQSATSGGVVFAEHCAVCHSLPVLAYQFEQMRGRPPGFVYDALTEGAMRRIGAKLDEPSRRAVSEFFTGVSFDSDAALRQLAVSPKCSPERSRFDWNDRSHPNWGGTHRNQRSIPDGEGYTRADVEKLKVQWVVAFPEATQLRSQPTAAGGALFVGSHNGSVYALDQETGCTRWHYKAVAEVRTAVTLDMDTGAGDAPSVRAIFADRAANAYALDATTGKLLWKRSVDAHPSAAITGSVTAADGRVFVPVSSNEDVGSFDPRYPCCTHQGAVVALDASSGELLWRTPTIALEPRISGTNAVGTPIWGPSGASVWNTPTLSQQRGLLYVGSGNNHSRPASSMSDSVLAMDIRTGRIVWTYQGQADDAWNAACLRGITNRASCPAPEGPDTDFGATTMLLEIAGGELLIAGQKSGMLHALDPATGALLWKHSIARGGPEDGIRYGMASRDGVLFVPSIDSREDPKGGAQPGVFALAALDGARLWSSTRSQLCAEREPCEEAVGAPPLAMSDVVFAATVDGMLHALDPQNGEVLWQFDTAQRFTTLLGTPTRGGGIQGTAGPMYANGRLFVSSGYGQAARPGNALIVLAPE